MCLYISVQVEDSFKPKSVSVLLCVSKNVTGFEIRSNHNSFACGLCSFIIDTSYGQVLNPAHKGTCKLSESLGNEYFFLCPASL